MAPKFSLQIKLSVAGKAPEKLKSGINGYFSIIRENVCNPVCTFIFGVVVSK